MSERHRVDLNGREVEMLWGRVLVYDPASERAKWVWPVDAKEGFAVGCYETVVPEGVPIPPHPEPVRPSAQPVVPAVQQAAGTVAASAPSRDVGSTSTGPRVVRSQGGPSAPAGKPASAGG